jgi:hypothetical protein
MSAPNGNFLQAGLILFGAWCCAKTFTAPNPVPEEEEQKKYLSRSSDPLAVVLPMRAMTGVSPVQFN